MITLSSSLIFITNWQNHLQTSSVPWICIRSAGIGSSATIKRQLVHHLLKCFKAHCKLATVLANTFTCLITLRRKYRLGKAIFQQSICIIFQIYGFHFSGLWWRLVMRYWYFNHLHLVLVLVWELFTLSKPSLSFCPPTLKNVPAAYFL